MTVRTEQFRAWWKLPWRRCWCNYCKRKPGEDCIVQKPYRVGNLGAFTTRPHAVRLKAAALLQEIEAERASAVAGVADDG